MEVSIIEWLCNVGCLFIMKFVIGMVVGELSFWFVESFMIFVVFEVFVGI